MIQMVELHFRRPPLCDYAAIKTRAEEILESDLGCSDAAIADKTFVIIHKQHVVKYSDGQLPAQTAIFDTDQTPQLEAYRQEIEQSWRCKGAEEILAAARKLARLSK